MNTNVLDADTLTTGVEWCHMATQIWLNIGWQHHAINWTNAVFSSARFSWNLHGGNSIINAQYAYVKYEFKHY